MELTKIDSDKEADTDGSEDDGGEDCEETCESDSVSLVDTVLPCTPDLLYGTAVMLNLLFFLLASGDEFLNKMVQVTPALLDKKRVLESG